MFNLSVVNIIPDVQENWQAVLSEFGLSIAETEEI